MESDNGPVPYWHLQKILFLESAVTVGRGIRPGMGIEAAIPFRVVRGRIRYEDLAGSPFAPNPPDFHHRNETLTRPADLRVLAHFGTAAGAWSLGARCGTSVPVGRTEPNPFELGRLGLPHEHIQFGTGTWNPILSATAGRALGAFQVQSGAYTRLTLYENTHGYRAGNLYNGYVAASRRIRGPWGGTLGVDFTREEAERWSGLLEEEGNLGRSDITLSAGIGRPVPGVGNVVVTAILPVHSHVRGEQAKVPLGLSLHWSPF